MGWITDSEISSSHFEIEVTTSATPTGFYTISTVEAKGSPYETSRYKKKIVDPRVSDLTFVRIAAFDTGDWYVYSDVRSLGP